MEIFNIANYYFNPYAIPSSMAGVLVLGLGIYILLKNRKLGLNIMFFFICLTAASWFLSAPMMYVSKSGAVALWWHQYIGFLGIAFIPVNVYAFSALFTKVFKKRKWLIAAGYLTMVLVCLIEIKTDYLVIGVKKYFWGWYPVYGPWSYSFLIIFAASLFLSVWNYWLAFKKADSVIEKRRIKYVFIGFIVVCLCMVDYFAAYGIKIYPFGYIPLSIFVFIIAWTISKYKFLSITPVYAADSIVAAIIDTLIMIDMDMRIRFINKAGLDILGYKKEELIGQPVDIVCRYDYQAVKNKLIKDGFIKDVDLEFHTKKNKNIPFNISAAVINDDNGKLVGIVFVAKNMRRTNKIIKKLKERTNSLTKAEIELKGVVGIIEKDKKNLEDQRFATLNILEDISESQQKLNVTNKALQKRSQELFSLRSLSDELSGVLEIESAVKVMNKYLNDVFKFSAITYLIINPAEEGGLIYQSYFQEEVSEQFVDEIEKSLMEFLAKEKDNEIKAALKVVKNIKPQFFGKKFNNKRAAKFASQAILPLAAGDKRLGAIHITGYKSNLYDKKAEELADAMVMTFSSAIDRLHTLIHSQHSRTISLVESLSDGVVMFNNAREIVLKNPAFLKYTGLTIKDLKLNDFYNAFINTDIKKMIDEALKNDKTSHVSEAVLGNKFYEIFITPVKDNQNKIVGGATIMHDITHLKEIDRMKTEFVSVASHQLRTPLTAIKLFTDMLVRGEVGKLNKEQKEYLDNVHQSTERMVRLVNDLLNVTRIESGRLKVDAQPLDVKKFIENIIAEAKPLADARGEKIDFIYGRGGELPNIPLDQNLIRQVIHNLLVNAIRYAPEKKGKIMVTLRKENRNFIISVKDNGIGIPEEAQGRIFEKFYRADNAIKAITEGTGLGLYVSRMIVESSGGKFWFESEKDKGTIFYVQMPIAGIKNQRGERGLAIS